MVAPARACARCGAASKPDALFCVTCGHSLSQGACVDHPGAAPSGACSRCGAFLCQTCCASTPATCAACRRRALSQRDPRDRRLAHELWLVPCVSYAVVIGLAFAFGPGGADPDEILGSVVLALPLVAGALLAVLGRGRLSLWFAAALLGLDLLLMTALGASSYLPCAAGFLLPAHTLWRTIQLHRLRTPLAGPGVAT